MLLGLRFDLSSDIDLEEFGICACMTRAPYRISQHLVLSVVAQDAPEWMSAVINIL